jgi:putative hydrolase of the HAD superfamily
MVDGEAHDGRDIRAVAFDLHGVLTTDPFGGIRDFERELGLEPDSLVAFFRGNEMSAKMERDEIDTRAFWYHVRDEVQARSGVEIDLREMVRRMEGGYGPTPGMADLIDELSGRYGTALVTNVGRRSGPGKGMAPLERFDVVIESALEGVRKPEPAIYTLVAERLGVAPRHIVFVDDFEENLPPAEALGMATILFRSETQCRDDLRALGVEVSPSAIEATG